MTRKLWGADMARNGPITFTDARIDPNGITDRSYDTGWSFLDGCEAWDMASHAAAFLGMAPCPICHNGRLRRKHYCSGCDRTGLDRRATFPGLGVDQCPDPEWHASASVYDPGEDLAGGVGRRVKIRRGVARSRKVG
jgi:hypothetical protein